MQGETTKLFISVKAEDADDAYLDSLVRNLLQELREIEIIEEISPYVSGLEEEGKKGSGPEIGKMLVEIAQAGGLGGLFSVLGSWLARDKGRMLVLQIGDNKLELTGLTKNEQQELIQWFQKQTQFKWTV